MINPFYTTDFMRGTAGKRNVRLAFGRAKQDILLFLALPAKRTSESWLLSVA